MHITETHIAKLVIAETTPYRDNRGAFIRLFCEHELAELLGERRIVQINHSRTFRAGAIRGMHFQYAPHAEMKMVRCLKGSVWDVAVDLRRDSPTFLRWHSEVLTPENSRLMVIPEGCAHGFQVLDEDSELLYLHTAAYAPQAEGALRYDDPSIAINWPLPVSDVSDRDVRHPLITNEFQGLII